MPDEVEMRRLEAGEHVEMPAEPPPPDENIPVDNAAQETLSMPAMPAMPTPLRTGGRSLGSLGRGLYFGPEPGARPRVYREQEPVHPAVSAPAFAATGDNNINDSRSEYVSERVSFESLNAPRLRAPQVEEPPPKLVYGIPSRQFARALALVVLLVIAAMGFGIAIGQIIQGNGPGRNFNGNTPAASTAPASTETATSTSSGLDSGDPFPSESSLPASDLPTTTRFFPPVPWPKPTPTLTSTPTPMPTSDYDPLIEFRSEAMRPTVTARDCCECVPPVSNMPLSPDGGRRR
ncbi:hypothetical protein B0T26DRAFT_747243 [Lasiosphaeria miniovina]|uniref:Uncharacterized protein n=1 Tax=Lasiosphaeria miniovina TaxID=1954250 RepID=A0AA40B395_9PEZI|nr:uncharacterized protein B0T26DRAFT_747243 [Lasiosphaeria miniovina]KAK0726853.1 hypothetical protein B0T26DRAFT_747243 [Lasiosphaeria miniovina]